MIVIISTIITAATFLFTMFKYFNEKKEARRNTEFDQYRQVLDRVAGRYPDGSPMVDIQQISAVYQLLEFQKFKCVTLPILVHFKEQFDEQENSSFSRAVNDVYAKLSQN